MDREHVVGRSTGAGTVVVERGPVSKFADAVHDDSEIYQSAAAARAAGFDGIPVPPTYFFSAGTYWGKHPELQTSEQSGAENAMAEVMMGLMAGGGMILHGEEEFTYHRPVVVGETLTYEGKVVDLYSKESSSGKVMTFLVTEDVYRDAAGEPVLTARMNLIHRA